MVWYGRVVGDVGRCEVHPQLVSVRVDGRSVILGVAVRQWRAGHQVQVLTNHLGAGHCVGRAVVARLVCDFPRNLNFFILWKRRIGGGGELFTYKVLDDAPVPERAKTVPPVSDYLTI